MVPLKQCVNTYKKKKKWHSAITYVYSHNEASLVGNLFVCPQEIITSLYSQKKQAKNMLSAHLLRQYLVDSYQVVKKLLYHFCRTQYNPLIWTSSNPGTSASYLIFKPFASTQRQVCAWDKDICHPQKHTVRLNFLPGSGNTQARRQWVMLWKLWWSRHCSVARIAVKLHLAWNLCITLTVLFF